MVHPELSSKYIFNLPIKHKDSILNIYSDQRVSGYIYLANESYLTEVEKCIVNRDGPLVPLIADINIQATGGPLSNINNLYLVSTERTISNDITAIGGNALLYSKST